MEKYQWRFPEHFLAAFRCTEFRYAESFIKYGTIKFNSPNSWVQYAKNKIEGRGDLLEGTIASFSIYDIENAIALKNKYDYYESKQQLIKEIIDDKIYFKLKPSMNLPCFCFYRMKMDMFKCPNSIGDNVIECDIPASYFRDFSDQMTVDQVGLLPSEKKPSIIMIENYNEFEKRLRGALYSLGVKEDEIILANVRYVDYAHPIALLNYQKGRPTWFSFSGIPPMELTIKDNKFAYQNEGRIIVNTKNEKLKEYLLKNAINIGELSDIAQNIDKYCYDGVNIKIKCNIQIYKEMGII